MLFLKKIRSNISKYWPYFFLPLVVLYISSYAFDGNNGLMAHARLDAEILKLENKIAEFERNNDLLRVKISLIENEIHGIKYCGINGHRFSGGAVGFISYEYANRVESSIPVPDNDELQMPLVYFMITEVVLIFDHARQTLTVCSNVKVSENLQTAY